jgi:hypothetical protein
MTTPAEVHVELLLGRRVHDVDGAYVGRIEEMVALDDGEGGFEVRAYLVGRQALAERLGGGRLVRALLHLLMRGRGREGRIVPWDAMDLADPAHPRCTRPRATLAPDRR